LRGSGRAWCARRWVRDRGRLARPRRRRRARRFIGEARTGGAIGSARAGVVADPGRASLAPDAWLTGGCAMRWRLAVVVALALMVPACPAPPHPRHQAPATPVITGQVSYLERIALMPDAELRVRLLDVLASVPTVVIAERTIHPTGNVPISFELPVPTA